MVVAVRVKLKGLMRIKKTLASGKTIYYCYAWRGGPLLKDKVGAPIQPGSSGLEAAYLSAKRERSNPLALNLSDLVTRYKNSTDFKQTSASNQRDYSRHLDDIRDRFGSLTLEEIQRPLTRGAFKDWRDGMADKPRTADFAWTVLARVLSFAKDRGYLVLNIAERGGRIYRADRREKIWTDEQISAFEHASSVSLFLALQMALWTGQRKGDLLAMRWSQYDGQNFQLRQSKTKTRVIVPVHHSLQLQLKPTAPAETILVNSLGRPWTKDGFNSSWSKAKIKAGVTDLTFHDLRGTAVTRMALAGCTVAEIASISGHSLRDVETILDMHYLGSRSELARNAARKLNRYYET
ncbi:tyrosine-type recombinase/integrase [Agrobacterium sp. rho-8.1]|nr:site-specific integrase [Agrobacterium sp. rho-8.1]